mmetsp:Transcript_23721/g.32451  ORF Transcript_23721/g.32451 Transcript_23721/m.32451 type:complete len:283 (+) Transcript_23721:1088-1936(+)
MGPSSGPQKQRAPEESKAGPAPASSVRRAHQAHTPAHRARTPREHESQSCSQGLFLPPRLAPRETLLDDTLSQPQDPDQTLASTRKATPLSPGRSPGAFLSTIKGSPEDHLMVTLAEDDLTAEDSPLNSSRPGATQLDDSLLGRTAHTQGAASSLLLLARDDDGSDRTEQQAPPSEPQALRPVRREFVDPYPPDLLRARLKSSSKRAFLADSDEEGDENAGPMRINSSTQGLKKEGPKKANMRSPGPSAGPLESLSGGRLTRKHLLPLSSKARREEDDEERW